MTKKIIATLVLLAVIGGAAWTFIREQAPQTGPGVQVVASYYPLYDFARQVGGDKIRLSNMTPAGAEPHDFEPSAKDLARAQTAAVFIYNGGNLEPWAEKFTQAFSGTVVRAKDHIDVRSGYDHEHEAEAEADHGEPVDDPHFWLDPVLAQQIVKNIGDGLQRADPANADYYAANAERYSRQLADLDEAFRKGLSDCKQRTIIVSHESVGYLTARYNLEAEAITGLSPEVEPSAARLAELTQLVQQKQIRYVFFESLVSRQLADTIARESGAQTLVLDPIEGLTDEAQKAGKDYLGIQRDNLGNLRRALSCR